MPPDEPLAMTVHSLPSPEDPASVDGTVRTRNGRLKMLVVFLVCLAPVLASYFTFYVVKPTGHARYGELIEPQRDLPDLPARPALQADAPAGSLKALKGQWLLVSVAPAACDKGCENNLYWQRQLRQVLGREKDRVDIVWLVSDEAPVRPELRPGLAEFTVLRVPAAQLAEWLAPEAGRALPDHIYVVDPMGHWMMRFPAAMNLEGGGKAKRDLERLLRASTSWDQPGR